MNRTMTPEEVHLAMKALGLRRNRWNSATKNGHRARRYADRPIMASLVAKGHAIAHDGAYTLTVRGIDQLRLQIGEFQFRPKA